MFKATKHIFLGIGIFSVLSCSSNKESVPSAFMITAIPAGQSVSAPYGDGSGIVNFTMSAINATNFQLYLPSEGKNMSLYDPEGGQLSYTFSKNSGKNTSYTVLASACNNVGHVDTTLQTTVYYNASKSDVAFWKTSPADNVYFSRQYTVLNFGPEANGKSIEVDSTVTYQGIDGFGFALTGGSASLINSLNPTDKEQLLKELFTTEDNGIGISYLRISIGASDLSSYAYSYDETAGDSTLSNFNLNVEQKDLIPVLKDIVALFPEIKIVATPWSAPAWMKTSNSYVGGSLKPACYDVYARYFVKYILAMKAQGINIEAITPQNEPLNPYNNPSMEMQWEEQNNFIKRYLAPQFKSNGINTKIIVYDHNLDVPQYAQNILSDPETNKLVDGSAFHLYAGNIGTMSSVHYAFPAKNLYFTEQYTASTGDFAGDLKWHIQNLIVGATRNWSRNVLEWNLASDAALGPHTNGGCSTCLGGITISGGTVSKRNVSYYIIAHASRFVRPGAVRIGSTDYSELPNVAFRNADGRKVLIVLNNTSSIQTFNIQYNAKSVTTQLEAGSVGTYIW